MDSLQRIVVLVWMCQMTALPSHQGLFSHKQSGYINFLEKELRYRRDGNVVGTSICLEIGECITNCLSHEYCCHVAVHAAEEFYLMEYVSVDSCNSKKRFVYRSRQGRNLNLFSSLNVSAR